MCGRRRQMKKALLVLSIFLGAMLLTSCVYIAVPVGEPYPGEDYYEDEYPGRSARLDTSYFYDYLSPHGVWVNHAPYGFVWIPYKVGYGWRPYTHGRWIWSSHGWTWVSFFDWGWAPFHYGRWGWDYSLGWYWVPGSLWGPAWVTWRHGSVHIGWAPLPPDTIFTLGVGVERLPYPIPDTLWIFVDGRYFLHSGLYQYTLPVERNYTIIKKTMIKTNIVHRNRLVLNQGVDVETVSRLTNRKVSKHMLSDMDEPGAPKVRADEIGMYRPRMRLNERAEPEVVATKAEARDKVIRTRIKRTTEETSETVESQIKKEREREAKNLKESQERETTRIQKDKAKKVEEAESEREKARIEKDYEQKLEKAKKRHKTEKSMMEKRHGKEDKKIKEAKAKKEAEKKEPKKKVKKKEKKSKASSISSPKSSRVQKTKIRK
jgi:hypothetical protein